MFDVSLKLEHSMPFCDLSKASPTSVVQRWCNLEVDILEVESPSGTESSKAEAALRRILKGLGAKLIRTNRYSEKSLEAVVGCKCASDSSSVAIIEWAGCIPVMPVTYRGGSEYCRLLAFTKQSLDGAISRLSRVSTLAVQSRSVVPRETARGAITIPVDEFLGGLTKKQLGAFIAALQMGYYTMPKRATVDQIAAGQGMKRSTYEEHLRKAELKILQAVRPYARLAYTTTR